MKFCLCGCGNIVSNRKGRGKYYQYHANKANIRKGPDHPMWGKHHSVETRNKMHLAHLNQPRQSPMKGKKHKPETIVKMSLSHKGKLVGNLNPAKRPEVRLKLREGKLGDKNPMKDPEVAAKSAKNSALARIGRKVSKETKAKISKTLMGHPVSIRSRKKMSKSHKGKPFSNKHCMAIKALWADPIYREKQIQAIIKGSHLKPNKQEKKLNKIIQKLFPGEYKLNVKANIMTLGGKVPDFVNINGKKKLIEFYGEHWHQEEDSQKRIDYFKQFGWDTLVIWGNELKGEIKLLKEKLMVFNKKGEQNARRKE